jgi:hypothetical protein
VQRRGRSARHLRAIGIALAATALESVGSRAVAQSPLTPAKASGQSVTPAFEGWYKNPDGTYSISFGYYNRNTDEALEIPIGPNNNVYPGDANQGQPTRFEPRRHWGVFAVRVPADFGDKKIVWTLKYRGEAWSIPGNLHPNWEIDALQGEAGSGNTPPVLKFDAAGPVGSGPGGIVAGPLTASVGQPLTVTVWASDDGKAVGSISRSGRGGAPPTLTWFKHQGPGEVKFSQRTPAVTEGKAITTATFSEPGEYMLRVRANDASGVAAAGHAQCCGSNGFVKVVVK